MEVIKHWFLRNAEPWQFWRPGSGASGGVILVGCLVLAGALLLVVAQKL